MVTPDIELLTALVTRFVRRSQLTPDERREVLHIAKGLAAKDSAHIERLPVGVIRTRRKLIYRKLQVAGASQVISRLLALSLTMLAGSERL